MGTSRARIRHPSHQGAAGSSRLVGFRHPSLKGAAGSRVSLGGWIPSVRSTCPTPPPTWGAPSADEAAPRAPRRPPSPSFARRGQPPRPTCPTLHWPGTPGREGACPPWHLLSLSYLRDPEPGAERVDHAPAAGRVFCLNRHDVVAGLPRGASWRGTTTELRKALLFGRGEVCGLLAFG